MAKKPTNSYLHLKLYLNQCVSRLYIECLNVSQLLIDYPIFSNQLLLVILYKKDGHFLYQHKITLPMIYGITILKKIQILAYFERRRPQTLLSLGIGSVSKIFVNHFLVLFSNLVCYGTYQMDACTYLLPNFFAFGFKLLKASKVAIFDQNQSILAKLTGSSFLSGKPSKMPEIKKFLRIMSRNIILHK